MLLLSFLYNKRSSYEYHLVTERKICLVLVQRLYNCNNTKNDSKISDCYFRFILTLSFWFQWIRRRKRKTIKNTSCLRWIPNLNAEKKTQNKDVFKLKFFENQRSQLKNIPWRLVDRLFSFLIHHKIDEILQQSTHVERFRLDISFRTKHKPDDHRIHNQIIVKHRRFRPKEKKVENVVFLSSTNFCCEFENDKWIENSWFRCIWFWNMQQKNQWSKERFNIFFNLKKKLNENIRSAIATVETIRTWPRRRFALANAWAGRSEREANGTGIRV